MYELILLRSSGRSGFRYHHPPSHALRVLGHLAVTIVALDTRLHAFHNTGVPNRSSTFDHFSRLGDAHGL